MKRVYSKKQRHEIYKRLLKVVCKDSSTNEGLCYYLNRVSGTYWDCEIHEFPELNKHKPIEMFKGTRYKYPVYFAPTTYAGWETRIKWIIQAIKDTK
ncbi:MAG: hypothetical protein WCP46_00475 [Alphaproteobacteria bacterium]